MTKTDTRIGDVIGGRFRIVDKAGEGGMSIVWDARDTKIDARRAIKEVKKSNDESRYRVNVQSLRQEAELMKGLNHPLLPRIFDIIEENNRIYVVMDYIEGLDLSQVLKLRGSAVEEEAVVDWGIQLCEALQYLHTSVIDERTKQNKCIVYRDMKPSNVKLLDDGTVRIFDFGIAREYSVDKTDDTTALGTRGYASPEAFKQGNQTDPRSDIYSLGVTLFHLVTGHGPMEFIDKPNLPPIRSINPALSEGLEMVIIRCTQWDPNMRYQSCNEMRWDLEHLDEIIDPVRQKKQSKIRLFKTFAITGIACLVLGVGCLVGSNLLRGASYDGLMESAKTASTVESASEASEAEQLYTEAIELDGGNIEPYLKLVTEVYPADNSFSQSEASRFNKLYSTNKSALSKDKQYAYLCYKVGQLYYNYSGYGDELTTNSQSVPWFQSAIDDYDKRGETCKEYGKNQYDLSKVYVTIGSFSQTLQDAYEDGTESSAFMEYWNAFEEGVSKMATGGESALAQMRMYELVYNCINSEVYLTQFKQAGVSQSQAESLLTQVYNQTKSLGSNVPEITKEAYSSIINGYSKAMDKISAVFKNAAAGNASNATTTITSSSGSSVSTSNSSSTAKKPSSKAGRGL